nr:MAG TPA: hypothetical protein [Crassvirales sp.]
MGIVLTLFSLLSLSFTLFPLFILFFPVIISFSFSYYLFSPLPSLFFSPFISSSISSSHPLLLRTSSKTPSSLPLISLLFSSFTRRVSLIL